MVKLGTVAIDGTKVKANASRHKAMSYGHMLKAHQGATLRAQLHDFAICTVASGNAAQQRVLEAAGWKKLAEFENTRSGETTELWGHNVKGAE